MNHLRLPHIALALAACCLTAACVRVGVTPSTGELSAERGRSAQASATSIPTAAPGGALLLWARSGLPAAVSDQAAGVEHVVATAARRHDTLSLVGSRDAAGNPVDDLEPGWRIPVAGLAIDPASYAAVVPDSEVRDGLDRLEPGTVLLSVTSAARRHLDVGSSIDLVGRTGLTVVGVVPDADVGDAEIVVHADDAEAAGFVRDHSIVVRHDAADEESRERLVEDLRALLPPDAVARAVEGPVMAGLRDAPLVLSLSAIKARFGEFAFKPHDGARTVDAGASWAVANIVVESVPILGRVQCHRGIMDDLRAVLSEIRDTGLADRIDPSRYEGCFYARRISMERPTLSSHSWGIALDINVDLDLPGLGPPPDPEIVAIFARHGFRWGGDFLTPDNHHFEWVGELADDGTGPASR